MTQPKKSEWLCKKCGQCCHVFRKQVKNVGEVLKAHKEEVGFDVLDSEIQIVISGVCEHWDKETHLCKNYKNRADICKNFICKRYPNLDVPDGQLFKKRCIVCNNIRSFQAGTERDKQGVCGNCWVW